MTDRTDGRAARGTRMDVGSGPRGTRVCAATAVLLLAGGLAQPAPAQDAADDGGTVELDAARELDPVVVSGTRTETPESAVPGAITVIDRRAIEQQSTISRDLGDILAREVPGLSPSTGSQSNFGQTIRGRKLNVLIDGIPQSAPLRNIEQGLRTIDPSAIEKIEVVRGGTALYGNGATGGFINIITKQGGEGEPKFTTELGGSSSLTHPDDSLTGRVTQSATGEVGALDFSLSANFEHTGGFFDAEGDRIPPSPQGQKGLSDSNTLDLFGKLGVDIGEDQRVQVTANWFDKRQETDFVTVPGNAAAERKATTREASPPGLDPITEVLNLSLDYSHDDVLGSSVETQLYYNDQTIRFGFSPFFPAGGGQSEQSTEKLGGRLTVETPLPQPVAGTLIWGFDGQNDETAQPLADGRTFVPAMDLVSYAPFAQLQIPLGERFLLRGGLRHERANVSVDSFTTLFGGNRVRGGEVAFDETLFNAGLVFYPTDNIDLFASFSQGFSVADLGRALRTTTAASVNAFDFDAQVVNNYEIGTRGRWDRVSGSLSLFANTSEEGRTFGNAPQFQLSRQEELVYGVEGAVDVTPAERWRVGGNFTWLEGKFDSDGDGDLDEFLPGDRIAPPTINAYVEHTPFDWWTARVQMNKVFGRDRFSGSSNFGEGDVDGFVTFDLYSEFRIDPGVLRVGVENALNEQFITPIGQAFNLNNNFTAGQGARATVTYQVSF